MKRAQRVSKTSSSAINKSLGLIKAGLAGFAGGLSIGLLSSAIKGALDYAGGLGEVAQQLGVTTTELQTFRYAASQTGVSQDEMDKGLQKLTLSMSKAASGSKTTTAAFAAVGVSLADIATKSKTEIFGQIADQMLKQGGAAKNSAAGMAIFGKSVQQLTPLLDEGSAGINGLRDAAHRLGIVLSEEQIRNADKTADKLADLQTVLKANIASAVASNADAIYGLVNSLIQLIATLGRAGQAWQQYAANAAINMNELKKLNPFADRKALDAASARERGKAGLAGKSVTVDLKPARSRTVAAPAAAPVPQFLAGGGGGSKKAPRAPKDNSARDAFRFAEDMRRAEMDILRAKQDLATDYSERATLEVAMLDLERKSYEAELAYQVSEGERTKAQAAQLLAEYDKADALKRQAVMADEEAKRLEDMNRLADLDVDLKRETLERQAGLADTASERRAIELELLKLAYEEKRRTLERIIRESKDWAEIEAARRELATLGTNQELDRQAVVQGTQGPWEGFVNSGAPDKISEQMENLKVQGVEGLISTLQAAGDGWDAMKDTAISAIKQIIAELIRMQMMKAIFNILGSAAGAPMGGGMSSAGGGFSGYVGIGSSLGGGLPGFATGGAMTILGNHGRDRNTLSLNGLPIANVSHGERLSVSNDNFGGGGSKPFVFNNYARMSADEARRTGMQAAAGYRAEMNRATRKGF